MTSPYRLALYMLPGAESPKSAIVSDYDTSVTPPTATISYVDTAGDVVTISDVPKGQALTAGCVADFSDLNGGRLPALGAYLPTKDFDDAVGAVFVSRDVTTGNWTGMAFGVGGAVTLVNVSVVDIDPALSDAVKGCWVPAPTGF